MTGEKETMFPDIPIFTEESKSTCKNRGLSENVISDSHTIIIIFSGQPLFKFY